MYMLILSGLLVALSLSMDNFAVTIAAGCAEHCRLRARTVWGVSAAFAAAHFVMFAAGWFCGEQLGRWIDRFDHWIAFAVLVFIGARMVCGAFGKKDDEEASALCRLNTAKTILALAVATSLDALLVGVALSLTDTPFWLTILTLSVCVFGTSCTGFWLGAQLGRRFGKIMEALGGVALAGIGTKLLLGGLGIW